MNFGDVTACRTNLQAGKQSAELFWKYAVILHTFCQSVINRTAWGTAMLASAATESGKITSNRW
jgi:hypothetical protein